MFDARGMSAAEACRQIAHEVWRAERSSEPFAVHGLNSEHAVRDRLKKFALDLQASGDLPLTLRPELAAINFASDAPLSILERCEALIERSGRAAQALARMLIVQSIAGRLGRWAVHSAEIPDARTGRA